MAQQINELELMFERATSPSNIEPDLLAIDTIVKIIQIDKHLSSFAAQKIKDKVNSTNPKVVLQSLDILDECMTKCTNVHGEVGKFKFLNELIKLVSPKYKGDETSKDIQCKILDLLLIWTIQYPQEHKIKEAYDMLIKQGVVHEPPKSTRTEKTKPLPSDFDSIPQKLLLSTNPRDIQVANLMIKSMMENKSRSAEIKLKRGLELKKAMDNASLLNDMLNNFKFNETTEDELVTIRELYTSCNNLLPTISRLAEDVHNNELLGEALKVNDCLLDITKRYNDVVNNTGATWLGTSTTPQSSNSSADLLINNKFTKTSTSTRAATTLDELNEIFSSHSTPTPIPFDVTDVLKPISLQAGVPAQSELISSIIEPLKPKPLQLIDDISEDLFKEVLSTDERQGSFNKAADKTPLNALVNAKQSPIRNFADLDSIVSNLKTNLTCGSESNHSKPCDDDEMIEITPSDDNPLLTGTVSDVIDTQQLLTVSRDTDTALQQDLKTGGDLADRPLSNFNIEIDSITPGDSPPRVIMKETAGLEITLYFTKDRPRDDISVIVITTTNHNSISVKDYQFDASVSKPCKLRLQPASDTNLPGILPFRPPTKEITQIMLLSNKTGVSPKITCIVSYCLENDPDPVKESITITDLPN
ncbi:hypothetical protein HA402_003538 [Bradysia odoriphaga]|nr:hypothetical protein HA402_003538 [Bradysia odoriphaga]